MGAKYEVDVTTIGPWTDNLQVLEKNLSDEAVLNGCKQHNLHIGPYPPGVEDIRWGKTYSPFTVQHMYALIDPTGLVEYWAILSKEAEYELPWRKMHCTCNRVGNALSDVRANLEAMLLTQRKHQGQADFEKMCLVNSIDRLIKASETLKKVVNNHYEYTEEPDPDSNRNGWTTTLGSEY
jgi:hypothetical protein